LTCLIGENNRPFCSIEHSASGAAAVEQLGRKVKLYLGAYNNIRVTTLADLALAKIIAKNI